MSFDTLVQVEWCFSSISLQNVFTVDTDLCERSSFQARKLCLLPALLSFHIECVPWLHTWKLLLPKKKRKKDNLLVERVIYIKE